MLYLWKFLQDLVSHPWQVGFLPALQCSLIHVWWAVIVLHLTFAMTVERNTTGVELPDEFKPHIEGLRISLLMFWNLSPSCLLYQINASCGIWDGTVSKWSWLHLMQHMLLNYYSLSCNLVIGSFSLFSFFHIKTLFYFFHFQCDLCNGERVLYEIIIIINSHMAAFRIVVPLYSFII
jgi:hypothetical protein